MITRTCRLCGNSLEHSLVDLGVQPLSNAYVPLDRASEGDKFYPLHAFVCGTCFLVQLEEFESPQAIFSDYLYFSSVSTGWLRHAHRYAHAMVDRFHLGPAEKVVEVASNDGYLLQYFCELGIGVLGIEPAGNVAAVARAKGIPSEVAFFGEATAKRLRAGGHAADLMVANNVLAHVPDILDFAAGFPVLLKTEGVATFEFPHLLRQIEGSQFDQIYHEHFSYLSLIAVSDVARRVGLRVFDIEEVPTHGGSLRVFACHPGASHADTGRAAGVLEEERRAGLDSLVGYEGFAAAALAIKLDALTFLIEARRAGKLVCGYGAAAKGNTFLNYLGVGADMIQAVADRSSHKQGTLLPGSRIPVVAPEALEDLRPDYLLILPWNIRDEVMEQMAHARNWGCRFVTAIPSLVVS